MVHNLKKALTPTKALLYCRISSKGQTGLGSQEYRCRQHAEKHGYSVEAVFPDDVTGGGDFMKRPGMVALMAYLDAHPSERFVVIFDDLKRYARDVEFHLKLKRLMEERGAVRECLNYRFEDTPEGEFNETINAAVGALERKQNARQNRQKAIARVEQGYAIQAVPPIGLKYEKQKSGGKLLVRDEPLASIVQEALEGFASGRFTTQAEVKRFLESQPEIPKHFPDGTIRQQKVANMLRHILYAGYVSAPYWGIPIRDGKHKGLISKATFQRIQERLDNPDAKLAPVRKDINQDFLLRGAVNCACCNYPLTGGWSKGYSKSYAYYRCQKHGCAERGKSIPKRKIEGQFEVMLKDMRPRRELFQIIKAMLSDAWEIQQDRSKEIAKGFKDQAHKLDREINHVVDKMLTIDNPRALKMFEARIEKLEAEKFVALEKAQKSNKSKYSFSQMFELSLQFLSNPHKLWTLGKVELQKMVLRLTLDGPLIYDRKTNVLNGNKPSIFNMLGDINMLENQMVPLGRIELPASPLPRVRSTTELQRPEC